MTRASYGAAAATKYCGATLQVAGGKRRIGKASASPVAP